MQVFLSLTFDSIDYNVNDMINGQKFSKSKDRPDIEFVGYRVRPHARLDIRYPA